MSIPRVKLLRVPSGVREVEADLEPAVGPGAGLAVLAYEASSGTVPTPVTACARALTGEGLAVARVALGQPGGQRDRDGHADASDVVAVADHAGRLVGAARLLVGMGRDGAAVMTAAGQLADVEAVALVGAPFEHHHSDRPLLVMPFTNGRSREPSAAAADLDLADGRLTIVPLHGVSFLQAGPNDAAYVAGILTAWTGRHLALARPSVAGEDAVEVEAGDGLTASVRARSHSWFADEPTHAGGEDRGPTPHEHLLAGLGSCTTMTARLYADRKGWALDRVWVRLRHARDPRTAPGPDGRPVRVERFELAVRFEGDLTDAERERLLEIVARCPVHRTLEAQIQIVTVLDRGDPVSGATP